MDKLLKLLQTLRERFLPRLMLCVREGATQRHAFKQGKWRLLGTDDKPERGLFGQELLLIPDSATLFRFREFPTAHIKKQELAEAVQLDVATWSPWEEGVNCFYWPTHSEDKWQVAVWIWPTQGVPEFDASQAVSPTHVLPELAWRLASLDPAQRPAKYISREQEGGARAALVLPSGIPRQVSVFSDAVAEQRYWNSLEDETLAWPHLEDPELDRLPSARVMFYARKPGVQDWTDPLVWLKPVLTVFALYLFWLLGSALVIWDKVGDVDAMVSTAQNSAIEVVEQRERVTGIHTTLAELQRLRNRQPQFEQFLAVLSQHLPEDAWLEALQYNLEDGGTVDLSGKAQRSAGLAALFQALPEVEHAMFLGDIRREQSSGLEPFKIRLKLTQPQ